MTTAHLTRIRLNTRDRNVQRDLSSSVQLHKTIMRLAPDHLGDEARRDSGVLFRLDDTADGPVVLVQSQILPDLARLPVGYGTTQVRDLTSMFKVLGSGMQVRYRIAANASKRLRPSPQERAQGRSRGKVKALSGTAALEWWQRRAEQAGLLVHTAVPTPMRTLRGRGEDGLLHGLVRFDGLATVTDPVALTEAVLSGIGKGKAYGAGLLSLAPADRG